MGCNDISRIGITNVFWQRTRHCGHLPQDVRQRTSLKGGETYAAGFRSPTPIKDLEVDLAHLQTLHDFDNWAARGLLLPYKPISWDQIPAAYKDPAGRFTGLFMLTFANSYNKNYVSAENAPRDYADFLKPEFKNRIVITYPNDDDAVLYVFDKIIQKYGIGFIDQLKANGVQGCGARRRRAMPSKRASTPSPRAPRATSCRWSRRRRVSCCPRTTPS